MNSMTIRNQSPLHIDTPLLESLALSKAFGKRVYMKMEALQPSGSFKIRGVAHLCQAAYADGARTFTAASGGNAGLALAYACRKLGATATVFVPESAPMVVKEKLAAEGAKVVVSGKFWDEAHEKALSFSAAEGSVYVHPFDDQRLWSGHATLVDELKAKDFKPGVIVLSVGGAGLLCGVLEGLHRIGWNDVPVVAVETEGAAGLHQSLQAGRMMPLAKIDTIASTLASRVVADEAVTWSRRHQILPILVSDRQALSACERYAEDHRVIVEPACGAALSVLYDPPATLNALRDGISSALVIVCGGSGVSIELFKHWHRVLDERA